jgi:hypothetical protein
MAKDKYEGPIALLRSLDRVAVRDSLDALQARGLVDVRPGVQGQHATGARLVANVGPLELQARRPHRRVKFRDARKRPTWPELSTDDRAEVERIDGDLCRIFDALQSHQIAMARVDVEALEIELRGTLATSTCEPQISTSLLHAGGPAPAAPPGAEPRALLPARLGPLAERAFDLAGRSIGPVSEMLATVGDEIDLRPWLNPLAIFNRGSLRLGGRSYHALQNWPAPYRTRLRIDGAPVVELDYRTLHPRLLCEATGTEAGEDFYAPLVGDLPRTAVKIATNTLWCCNNLYQAIGRITATMHEQGVHWPRLAALAFVDRFAATYPAIVPFVACSASHVLQNIDGQIARAVMLELADVGCIGVHDSFVVPEHAADSLRAAMARELARGIEHGRDRLRACAGSTTAPELRAWLAEQIDDAEHERLAHEDRSGALL